MGFLKILKRSLSPLKDGKIVDEAVQLSNITNDFCGNSRNNGAPDIGTIECDAGPCYALAMLRAAENYGKY